jgi:hypothetical protein
MKYKTAIEWLEDNLMVNPFSEKDFTNNVKIFKKAKKMEKEQIKEAHLNGQSEWDVKSLGDIQKKLAEQYYNETYGKK